MGGLGIKMDSILERKLFAGVMSGTLGLIGLQERNHPQGGLLGSEGGGARVTAGPKRPHLSVQV